MIYTIGHSTHPLKDFLALLKQHAIAHLVDVRTVPRSAHRPQFNREWLPAALGQTQIAYTHMPALGGFRHARKGSVNTGWQNPSFRGYADYMQTEDFARALDQLVELSRRERTAIMCAEAVPWRCHRSLIADAATARGEQVQHIMSTGDLHAHAISRMAKVEDGRVTYPGDQGALAL